MKRQLRHLALFACITATAALGSQSAFAGCGSPNGGRRGACSEQKEQRGHGGMFKKMAKELGLTDQQKKEARAIFEAQRGKDSPLFDSLRNERRGLQALVHSGSADESAVRAQAAKVAALQADLAVQKAAQARQFLALLTPDQAAKFKELRQARRGGFGEFPLCRDK